MFNFSSLLNFFKKKPAAPAETGAVAPGPVEEKQIQLDDIAIYTMPERFRHQPQKASSAKNVGVFIMAGGIIVLIAASALLYYYLFKKPTVTVKPEPRPGPTSETAEITPEPLPSPVELATTTPLGGVILPADNTLATSTATTTPARGEQELALGLIPALDSDSDGLTDAEEIIFKTATSTPDTDGDGYLDGAELANLYDPAGPGRLASSSEMALYENIAYGYQLLYPDGWQLSNNGGDDSIMFRTDDNQFFQIIVQPNAAGQTLDQWYFEQLGVAVINEADRLSGANWQGVKNLDGLTLYLMDAGQKYIFTLAYNPGENNILDYIDIFKMMIKSFILKQ